jgi:DedD protein
MNSLLDDDDVVEREHHEVTLGTGTILAIFLGLVLLCGLFFGFGYKIGSRKGVMPEQAAAADPVTTPATNFSSFKPAAGSPVGGGDASPAANNDAQPAPTRAKRREIAREEKKQEAATAPTERSPATATAPEAPAPGAFVVQVAAVSHQEDAELLVNALRAKGYPVSAHTEPQDKFFHIQVGPFATHKDADIAKQRLLADGYQPIVK